MRRPKRTVNARRVGVALVVAVGLLGASPAGAAAKTCSGYPNQAAAQRAADTRDADGDGIYCESLPCPCSTGTGKAKAPPKKKQTASCTKPKAVQKVRFSRRKYPNIRKHYLRAVRKGWPRTLKVHRRNAGVRRDRALEGFPTRKGYDRDECPPAVGRATWRTDIAYVRSGENRSHGSSLGAQLRGLCSGTRFRYVFF